MAGKCYRPRSGPHRRLDAWSGSSGARREARGPDLHVLEHPNAAWLPTEDEKVNGLTGAGISKTLLPHRLYQGAVGVQVRYFPHKLPVALDAGRATFLFVRTEDQTASEVRTWGSQHAALWAALLAAGAPSMSSLWAGTRCGWTRPGGCSTRWTATAPESVAMSRQEASTALAAIRKALVTSDWAAMEAYGDINGALRRMSVLADAAETRGLKVAVTSGRIWRSMRVPKWIPAGRSAGEAA